MKKLFYQVNLWNRILDEFKLLFRKTAWKVVEDLFEK
jgi:hypothetical protein